MLNQAQIVTFSEAKKLRFPDKKVVLAGGGFDVLHTGHIKHLEEAKSFGDILIVHITGDKRYFIKKNRKPIFSAKERADIISAIRYVDYVFVYNDFHYSQKVVDQIKPDILYFNKEAIDNYVKEYLKHHLNFSGNIIISKLEKENSSSSIKKNIHKKEPNS